MSLTDAICRITVSWRMGYHDLMRNMCRNDLALSVALVVVGLGALVIGLPLLVADFPEDSKWEAIWICVTALFTVVLAISTIMLWGATKAAGKRADSAIRTIERAYVKISHLEPGAELDDDGTFKIRLQIRNFGRTPATVTGVHLKAETRETNDRLPTVPDYGTGSAQTEVKVFLVTNDEFFLSPGAAKIEPHHMARVKAGQRQLYVYGFVEYTDAFDKRFRAGYARVYDHTKDIQPSGMSDEKFKDRSNLVFITAKGYNYDVCLDEEKNRGQS